MADVLRKPRIGYIPPDTLQGQPWWLQPLLVVAGLGVFTVYALWSALQGQGYAAPYLSPFYSPQIPVRPVGLAPFLILWIPLGFRATCYYYRKAYYRSFFFDPPACVRPEPRSGRFNGERVLPWVLNNFHRYFLYITIVVVVFLWFDVIRAFDFNGHLGVGLGTLIMLVNVVALSAYTFSCHSFRHLVGGGTACFSCAAGGNVQHRLWTLVSTINSRHPRFAWVSIGTLFAADIYIRLMLWGVIADPRWVL
jgi:hypothetical protein